MKTVYIGAYRVPDGYFGDRKLIHLLFDPSNNTTIEVHENGFYRGPINAICAKEVKWQLEFHPTYRKRYVY